MIRRCRLKVIETRLQPRGDRAVNERILAIAETEEHALDLAIGGNERHRLTGFRLEALRTDKARLLRGRTGEPAVEGCVMEAGDGNGRAGFGKNIEHGRDRSLWRSGLLYGTVSGANGT